jgi:chemotaxis protein MotA
MLALGGFGFLIACVFGSYIVSGGSLGPLLEALPFELWTIGGAALGTLIMANSLDEVKHLAGDFGRILRGGAFHEKDYMDLLSLLFFLIRTLSTKGAAALEAHIEKPEDSTIFQQFPKLVANKRLVCMICDYLRLISMYADDPNQIEDLIARDLKKTLEEDLHGAHALQTMADALPALGIVAAVLGVVKTMSHINEPPAVLGAMIGGALVGTFLGVLLAYGLAGPLANRLRAVVTEDSKFYEVVRAVLVAHLHGNAPQVSIESGRKMAPNRIMPSFYALEEAVQSLKIA